MAPLSDVALLCLSPDEESYSKQPFTPPFSAPHIATKPPQSTCVSITSCACANLSRDILPVLCVLAPGCAHRQVPSAYGFLSLSPPGCSWRMVFPGPAAIGSRLAGGTQVGGGSVETSGRGRTVLSTPQNAGDDCQGHLHCAPQGGRGQHSLDCVDSHQQALSKVGSARGRRGEKAGSGAWRTLMWEAPVAPGWLARVEPLQALSEE